MSSTASSRPPANSLATVRRGLRTIAAVLLLALATVHPVVATDGDSTQTIVAFDAANKLYEQGKFPEAARAYQQLIDAGQGSVTLYFNLGNAWFKAPQTGRAIAAYRQAARLAPRDPNVQFNLAFARKRVASGEPSAGTVIERMLRALTLNEWTTLAASAFWLSLLFLAAGEVRESFRGTARRYAAIAATAALLLGAGVVGAASRWVNPAEGVIVASEAIVRSGPLEEAKVLHQFRDGTEIKVLDQKKLSTGDKSQTWFQVSNGSAQSGWIKEDQLVLIR